MSKNMINQSLLLTSLFGAFVFLQFTVLGLANHAGEGYLTTAQREFVYYGLQIFVILGFVLYSLFFVSARGNAGRTPLHTVSLVCSCYAVSCCLPPVMTPCFT